MANIRIFTFLLILLIIINCALVQARNDDDLISREKRMLFSCAKAGKRCTSVFGKSCCGGLVCNTTIRKCVRKGSSISWLGDRNGK